ncbi:MAG: hemin-degrading protein HmuS [Bacteroidetes bacterium HLUCCA01]|nr:MAG: hemin-degrading protein HmuS [Bacteroidetes bacterium HLUCCA01]
MSAAESLRQRWEQTKQANPRMRALQIARTLGVSEAELVASACDGKQTVRLNTDWSVLFSKLERLGEVMALTRNEAAVHEKTGVYRNVSFKGFAGLVLDEEIDLRVFHQRWGFAFALPVENARGTLLSLQFFDKEGHAVHKIYLKDADRARQFNDLVEEFRHPDQSPFIEITRHLEKDTTRPAEHIDKDALLRTWSALRDTHDFFPMLRDFEIGRTDALKLAEGSFSWKVKRETTQEMLLLASGRQIPIMVFVGNSGMIQIHSGPVQKIKVMENWVNIMDPRFNLHLREDLIAETWIVEKPTDDGPVTSLELFDAEGAQIVTFFGARKPGKPELASWTDLTSELKKQMTA